MKEVVDSILMRRPTPAELFNIDKPPGATVGGGGQTYFDLPLQGLQGMLRVAEFIKAPNPNDLPAISIPVKALGTGLLADLEFSTRPGANGPRSYRIGKQNINQSRHPAWHPNTGFPQAPGNATGADDTRLLPLVKDLKIFVVRTVAGNYYAGFTTAAKRPAGWPERLNDLFTTIGAALLTHMNVTCSPTARRILETWKRNPNVLLYGPPGTGKTHVMHEVWELLKRGNVGTLLIDPANPTDPFSTDEVEISFPLPIRQEWVTFHQNYSYENFMLGFKPKPASGGGFSLKPAAGTLLDMVMDLEAQAGGSGMLFIDEINRGNVSRIFGELITFLDPEYRKDNRAPLPVPLPGLCNAGGQTEDIERLNGSMTKLPVPLYFPNHFYVLASMNSVDRAVAPLDTALARRFARLEIRPSSEGLAKELGVDIEAVQQKITGGGGIE